MNEPEYHNILSLTNVPMAIFDEIKNENQGMFHYGDELLIKFDGRESFVNLSNRLHRRELHIQGPLYCTRNRIRDESFAARAELPIGAFLIVHYFEVFQTENPVFDDDLEEINEHKLRTQACVCCHPIHLEQLPVHSDDEWESYFPGSLPFLERPLNYI